MQGYVNLFDCHQENITLPLAFMKHMNFLEFEESNKTTPIYINVVRHPIDRVISWYYYIRQGWFSLKFEFQNLHPNKSPTLTWSYLLLKSLTKGIKDGNIQIFKFSLQCWKSVEHFLIFLGGTLDKIVKVWKEIWSSFFIGQICTYFLSLLLNIQAEIQTLNKMY